MAYSVREERQSLAVSLREDLDKAERAVVQLRRDNVESFLQLLDGIEGRFAQLEPSGLDLRTEFTRWASLQSKLRREASRISRVLDLAGGLAQLRQDNLPAQGLWWHLDEVVAAARRHLIRRLGITTGTIVGFLAIVWVLLTFVFPPDPNTVLASEAISTLQQMAFEGRWDEALEVIEVAKAQLTKPDPELLIWEGVIRDKLGQSDRAMEALAEAKELVPAGKLVSYWWTVGSVWLSVVDAEKARSAANEAIAFDASDPRATFCWPVWLRWKATHVAPSISSTRLSNWQRKAMPSWLSLPVSAWAACCNGLPICRYSAVKRQATASPALAIAAEPPTPATANSPVSPAAASAAPPIEAPELSCRQRFLHNGPA